MPESGAVYQPTTVGYAYDTRDGSGYGIRSSFSRIMSRHKFSTRNWLEWVLFTVSVAAFIVGLTIVLVNLVSAEDETNSQKNEDNTPPKDSTTEVTGTSGDGARASTAIGAGLILVGVLLGLTWAWLRFFQQGKSPRGGLSSNSGQMLGGLSNPSSDLLTASTSQYGPVLTEVPSQLKSKQTGLGVSTALPMSDQEEETHTLMEDSQQTIGSSALASQIPG